jgi:hypothetical protein
MRYGYSDFQSSTSRSGQMRRIFFYVAAQTLALIIGLGLTAHAGMSFEDRTQYARWILSDLKQFADLLQTPKPADIEWVESEQAAIRRLAHDSALDSRQLQLYESPEFQHVKVYNYIQDLQGYLRCVVEGTTTLQREMYCWAEASSVLSRRDIFGDGRTILHKAKRLPDNPKGGTYDDWLYTSISGSIQSKIIIPYLRGDLKS